MDNNDKFIIDFINVNKHEIEDKGFSEEVIAKAKNRDNFLVRALYIISVIFGCSLFYLFDELK